MIPRESERGGKTPPIQIRLDHIGIATAGLADTLAAIDKVFERPHSPPEEVAAEGVRLAFIDFNGPKLEFLESAREDSVIARFLERHRPGVHHLSFEISGVDIDQWYQILKSRGVEVLGNGPKPGAGGKRIFFIHPRSTGGVLIEFSQASTPAPPRDGARKLHQ
jgi:methylmalonyl-CoA epimerase